MDELCFVASYGRINPKPIYRYMISFNEKEYLHEKLNFLPSPINSVS
jgi:hypothetical protein